jgi:hypothetical protein
MVPMSHLYGAYVAHGNTLRMCIPTWEQFIPSWEHSEFPHQIKQQFVYHKGCYNEPQNKP